MVTFGGINVLAGAMSITGPATALYRLSLGGALLAVLLRLTGRGPSKAMIRVAAPAGAIYGVHVGLMFSALQATSIANATVILTMQPALALTVVGRLFGERVSLADVGLAVVATAGVILVIVGGESGGVSDLRGDLLAVGGTIGATAYLILAKRARTATDIPAGEYQLGLLVVGTATMVPVVILLGDGFPGPVGWDWARLVGLAAGGTAGHLGLNWAHRHVPLRATSMLTLAVPVVSTALAWALLGQEVSAVQFIGAGVTIAALAAVITRAASTAIEAPTHHSESAET